MLAFLPRSPSLLGTPALLLMNDASASVICEQKHVGPGGLTSRGAWLPPTVRRAQEPACPADTILPPGSRAAPGEGPRSCTGCHTCPVSDSPAGWKSAPRGTDGGSSWPRVILAPGVGQRPPLGLVRHQGMGPWCALNKATSKIQALPTVPLQDALEKPGSPFLTACSSQQPGGQWPGVGSSTRLRMARTSSTPGLRTARL